MKHIEKIKEMLNSELEIFGKKNALTVTDLERIHKLSDTIKNLDKITILEEESGYSEDADFIGDGRVYGTSYARGRGRYAKRDRMGRYSSDYGTSYDDDYSERRMGRGYSRGDATDHMMKQLGEMMDDTNDPKEREALKECMRALERM